jgi:hypothetical protein
MKKVFVIMAVRWAARHGPKSRERADASPVPLAKGRSGRDATAYEPGLRGPFAYPEPFDYV